MICLSFTVQPITTASSPLWVKIEQVLLPISILVYMWLLLVGLARMIRFNSMFLIGAIYFVSTLVSIWYGADLLRVPVIPRDFYELPKLIMPVGFFTFAFEAELSEASLKRLLKFFGFSICLVCLYAWAQWWGLGISYTLNQYYSAGVHDDALFSARRVYSTMGNPNLLGQLVTWAMAAFLLAAIYKVGNRAWNLALALACLVVLAMTGSRYGLLDGCMVFVLIYVLPSYSTRRLHKGWFFLALISVFVLAFGIVALSNPATLARVQTLRNPLEVDSLQGRVLGSWRNAGDDIWQSPFFGRGPSKMFYTGVMTDSEYLDVLKRFGIVGFVCYLPYFLYPLVLMVRGLRAAPRAGPFLEERMPATLLTLRFATIITITSLVMNIGMSTMYSALIQGFLWLWMGLGARCAKTIVDASKAAGVKSRKSPGEFSTVFPGLMAVAPRNWRET
jgi:hypothetical protein